MALSEGKIKRLRTGAECVTSGSRLLKPNTLKVLLPAIKKVALNDKTNIPESENIYCTRVHFIKGNDIPTASFKHKKDLHQRKLPAQRGMHPSSVQFK